MNICNHETARTTRDLEQEGILDEGSNLIKLMETQSKAVIVIVGMIFSPITYDFTFFNNFQSFYTEFLMHIMHITKKYPVHTH